MAGRVIELKADLDRSLNIGEETVSVAAGELAVRGAGGEILRLPLKGIERVFVESGLGIGKLVAKRKGGGEVEVAYFTKECTENFSRLANAINDYYLKGKGKRVVFEPGRRERGGGVNTLRWLYGFASDHLGLMALGMGISVLLTLINLVPPYLLKILIDNVILSSHPSGTLFQDLTAALVASYVLALLLNVAQGYFLNKAGNRIVANMRGRLFAHVMKLPPAFIDRMSTGRILSRLISDAGNTQWLMTFGIPTVVTNTLTVVGIGVILFSLYPPLALYVLIPVPFIVYVIYRYRSRSQNIYHKNWRKSADMTSMISDVVPNYTIVKAASKEGFEADKFGAVVSQYYGSQMAITRLNILSWPFIGFLTSLATVMIWWVGGNSVISGSIQLGIITAFIAYMATFYGPINQLGNTIPFVQQSITSGDRLRELFDERVPPLRNQRDNARLRGDIVFRGVSFEYAHPFPTIKNVSMTIKEGTRVAIVGKSGSGKTTLAKLLLGLYRIDEGRITIGGRDISRAGLENLRKSVAYVPQEAVLFDNSVAYNLSYYTEYGTKTPLEVMRACADAALHDEVMRMPLAYDTNIGERGYSMSGGQRQRLSIARAILTDPNIVLLDEVTSNLDAINAAEVGETIARFVRDRTAISITHNASEITGADRVLLMDEGMLVEQGTPRELIGRRGKFYGMLKGRFDTTSLRRRGAARKGNVIARAAADAGEIDVARGGRRSLVDAVCAGRRMRGLMPKLPFPISNPQLVILYDRRNIPQVIIGDIGKLRGDSREALADAVAANNFKPRVLGVRALLITGDGIEWRLRTDRGERTVVTRSRRSVMQVGDRIVLLDMQGSVFEMDLKDLDERSRALVEDSI